MAKTNYSFEKRQRELEKKRKQEEMVHPFVEEKMTLGLFYHIQALLFARYLRGELDGYPPVIWK